MARSVWNVLAWIVAVGIVCVVGLLVLVGPTVYREGRAVYEPIRSLTSVEERLRELNATYAFVVPEEISIDEERLESFLSIRRLLKDQYDAWQSTIEEVEDRHGESWTGAKKVIGLTSKVFDAQVENLAERQMSPDEFLWLERVVYRDWLREIERLPGDRESAEVNRRLREATEQDLEYLESLQSIDGQSAALSKLERRFRQRLIDLESPVPQTVEGFPSELNALLWRNRDRIVALDLSAYPDIHSGMLKASKHEDGSAFRIKIG